MASNMRRPAAHHGIINPIAIALFPSKAKWGQMKILVCHNRYKIRGGEDIVVEQELELLKKNGLNVRLYTVENKEIQSPWDILTTAATCVYSPQQRRAVSKMIADFQPDILHVHNFFPRLTPAIYGAAKDAGIPVVQTLHNYRLICANGLFLRNHKPCELCLNCGPAWGLLHGCYRNSRLATLPVATSIKAHKILNTWNRMVDQFIVPTEFGKKKFIQFGINSEKITVKPNFTNTNAEKIPASTEKYFVYVGRLSEEKGFKVLLEATEKLPYKIKFVGDGVMPEIKNKNIELLGPKSHKQALEIMAGSSGLIFPSICYEGGFPLALMEAMSLKTPIIASNIGTIPEYLNNSSALLFEPGNIEELRLKITQLAKQPEQAKLIAEQAFNIWKENFTAEKNFTALLKIYQAQKRDLKTF